MKAVSGKHLARLAEQKGWKLVRISGSHHIYALPGTASRVVIPIHGNQSLKIGLLRGLMKLIPLTEEELT